MFQIGAIRGRGATTPPYPYSLYKDSLCWLFMGDEFTDLADNTPISTWTDQSPLRHDLFMVLPAYQPTVEKSTLLNGHVGVTFDGSNDHMKASDRLLFDNELTIFIVINNATDAMRSIFDLGYQSNYGHQLTIRSEDNGCIDWYYNNPRIDLNLTAGPNLLVFQAYSWDTGDHLAYWLNGSFVTSVVNGAIVGGISYGDIDNGGILPRVGVFDADNSGSNYNGIIYEMAFFNEKLAETDRALIETYLMNKYGF